MAEENGKAKPNIIILGGTGFIGRNLVHYLVTEGLAGKVRVVDRVMPGMAWLSAKHKESFSKIQFKHANLINAKSAANAFQTAEGEHFDFVINCAAETRYGHTEAVYRDGIYKLSVNCAREAAKHRVKRYIEISSAHMKPSDKKPISEEVECEPWTMCARQKLLVETDLRQMSELDYVVVRPATVYGPGDKAGLMPRLVIGGVYKYLKEKMQMLYTASLKYNTVHVQDVCRAIVHLCNHGDRGEVYNLADQSDTTQGKIGDLISQILNINHDYVGSMLSSVAKINSSDITGDINEKHMQPWGDACRKEGILNTPLNPHLDEEQLTDKGLCIDGRKIEKTGFHYEYPHLTAELLKEVLDEYVEMGLYPRYLVTSGR